MTTDQPRLVLASGNRHKIIELREMVAQRGIPLAVIAAGEIAPAPEIVEDADSFSGNAILKARGIAAWLRERGEPATTLVLADDSGVSVDALDGRPGVYSARFAGPGATDEANNERLVRELRALGLEHSPAHYSCVLALVRVGGGDGDSSSDGSGGPLPGGADLALFEGRWEGIARIESRGTGGFGYDPHVWLDWPGDGARTVAELTRPEKATVSHRGLAMEKLMAALVTLPGLAPEDS